MLSELRFAIRRLRRTPGFTIATVVTLAVGIGATTAVYSVVDGVLLRPLPFDRPERIVTLGVASQEGHFGVPGGVIQALDRLPAIERVAVFIPRAERTLRDGMDPEQLSGAVVSDGFFPVFRTAPLIGRTFAGESGAGVSPLVLSERVWRRRYGGDRSVIGRVVGLEGKPHVVVGVMPRRFAVPEDPEFWAPLTIDAQQRAEVGTGPFDGVGRLRSGDVGEASVQAATLSASINTMADRQQRFVLTPMLETIGRPYRSMLMLLLAASGMVLLIACANAAHLSVAQMRKRTQELAVRSAIGATRRRIVRQLATEAVVLTAPAAVGGLLIAWILLRLGGTLALTDLPRAGEIGIDGRIGVFTVIVSAASLVVFGVLPAWFALRRPPGLTGARHITARGRRIGSGLLVASEVAIALVLSVGSALTLISVFRLVQVDPGFDARRFDIVTVRPSLSKYTGADRARFHERVLDRLRRVPGVQSAAAVSHVPLDRRLAPRVPVSPGSAGPDVRRVSSRVRQLLPGTLQTLGVPVLRGREFTAGDAEGGTPVAIVNERLAQALWPNRDPLGETLSVPTGSQSTVHTVVGVAGNIRGSLPVRPTLSCT